MTFKIDGLSLEKLEELGKKVEIAGAVSISGTAADVGCVYLACGLFGQVVAELKKFAPKQKVVIDDETRIKGRLMGLSDADMDAMADDQPLPVAFQTIPPSKELPFGATFPIGDNPERHNALVSFRWVLSNFVASIGSAYEENAKRRVEACSIIEAYWRVLHDFFSEKELELVFDGLIFQGKSLHRHNEFEGAQK